MTIYFSTENDILSHKIYQFKPDSMKQTRTTFIFIIFSIIFFNLSYSQSLITLEDDTVFVRYKNHDELSYHSDTIVFMPYQRNMLFGTTLLPFTKNQSICENYGLTVDKV